MKDFLVNDLGRKFLYALLVTVLGFVLVLLGKLNTDSYMKFVEIVGATYVVGNIGEHVSSVLERQP